MEAIGLLVFGSLTLICIILAVALFMFDKRTAQGSWYLGLFLIFLSLMIIEGGLLYTKGLAEIPQFLFVGYGVPFLLGPFAYFFIRKQIDKDYIVKGVELLHFFPILWFIWAFIPHYLDYSYINERFINDKLFTGIYYNQPKHLWITILQLLSLMAYFFLMLYHIFYSSRIKLFKEATEEKKHYLQKFTFLFGGVGLLFMAYLMVIPLFDVFGKEYLIVFSIWASFAIITCSLGFKRVA